MIKIWVDRNLKGDPVIWAIVLALSILSILVVYSATGTLAYKKPWSKYRTLSFASQPLDNTQYVWNVGSPSGRL